MTPDQLRLLNTIEHHIEGGRPEEARKVLARVAAEVPDEPRIWWARATLAQMTGDVVEAETALRRTAALDAKSPFPVTALGDLLFEQGRGEEAATAWREALTRDAAFTPAVLHLAEYLIANGDLADALPVLDRAAALSRDPSILVMRAGIHNELGDIEQAIADHRATVKLSNSAPGALRNLATALVADGQAEEGEAVVRQALAAVPADPNLWQVLGRALQSRDALEEAQAAFEKALDLQSEHPGAQRDLAHLVWARTGDLAASTVRLDRAINADPGLSPMIVVKAKILEFAGEHAAARALLTEAAQTPGAANYLLCAASQALVSTDRLQAATLAATAVSRAPTDTFGLAVLAEAQLSAGDLDGAEITSNRIRSLDPLNQHGLALSATAWRLKDDPRHRELYDYDAFVSAGVIETPEGWSDLSAYLADLKTALTALHGHTAEPIGQSLRGGTQTNVRLERSKDPAVQAFFKAIDAPIRAYIAALGEGDDPMRSRANGQDWKLSGAWSVRLSPGGRHVDHLHDKGWISSAFYVDLPDSVLADGEQGSLRLGQPGTPTRPALEAERRIKPQPGLLVLFPSYMWHGTEAFDGDQPRLTIAFDVVPG